MFPTRDVIEALKDPASPCRWFAMFQDYPPGPNGINIESISIPFQETGHQERSYGGRTLGFPATASLAPVQITLYEDHLYATTSWLNDWKRQVFDPATESFGVPAQYLRDLVVFLYPTNDSDRPSAKVDFKGCFPADSGGREYSYNHIDGRILVTVALSVRYTVLTANEKS